MSRALDILILDDDIDLAEGLADILEMLGHNVVTVHNGTQAIDAFTNHDFDVGFFDVRMSGMNGVESFIEIRKIKPEAKVFMMTGYSVEQILEQALDHGALGVLRKPFDVQDVLSQLQDFNEGLIVVADDDQKFTNRVVPILEEKGYRVRVAATGQEALEFVDGSVELLILNLDLPIISGLEVYLEMKDRGQSVPTILLTARSEDTPVDVSPFDRQSVSGVFQKPFDPQELIDLVTQISLNDAVAA